MKEQFNKPILLLAFKRPETTRLVFNEIKKIKPKQFFIGVDGPRENNNDDLEKCKKVKEIFKEIDWDCEVKTLFREKNLGSMMAESSAINWFFDHVEEGIILEDDCLPNQSFFKFCKEMLDKYKNDTRIMHISGNNFLFNKKIIEHSYYFSKLTFSWGWATWKRAWKYYDVDLKTLNDFIKQDQISNIFPDHKIQEYWLKIFKNVRDKKIDAWDYQWLYTNFTQNGLSIIPKVNLVSNIGFNEDGTYCKDKKDTLSNMETFDIENIEHPKFVIENKNLDKITFENIFYPGTMRHKKNNIFKKIKIKLTTIIKK